MLQTIIASNRSPIDYQKGVEGAPSVGGLTRAMVSCLEPDDLWVAVSQGDDDPNRVDEQGIIQAKGDNYEFLIKKIFLDPKRYEQYYEGFSNSFLWPLFHLNGAAYYEMSTTFPRPKFDGNDFFHYSLVNHIFARAVLEEAKENTTVWIQDYHLLLTPAKIKVSKPNLSLGQFIHTPMFKPAIVSRYLAQNGEAKEGIRYLLDSMLSNNLLGFHIPEYVQNFSEAVKNFFPAAQIEETAKGFKISCSGRNCYVEDFPIGTDVEAITKQIKGSLHIPLPEGKQNLEDIVKEDREKKRLVFAGLERGDYTKGLVERLSIVDELLQRKVNLRYIGLIAPSREGIGAYQKLIKEMNRKKKGLNAKWFKKLGYIPIIILYQNIKPPQHYLLLKEADCVLMPLYEDGMNLVFNEGVLAKQGLPHGKRGFFAMGNCGAAKAASKYGDQHGLVRIDPFDIKGSAEKIIRCLEDKYDVSDALIKHVQGMDINTWKDDFLKRLREIKH